MEPILCRLLGAVLLALAWSSFLDWRSADRQQVAFLVEMEAAFTVLGCIGILWHLLIANYPLVVWLVLVILAAFAIVWIIGLVKK